jgi:hypothetical protein
MSGFRYVPILKGKQGEYRALRELTDDQRSRVRPLIEVPPIAWDFANECPSRTLDAHLQNIPTQIARSWSTAEPLMLDVDLLPNNETTTGGLDPLTHLVSELAELSVNVVPVTGLERPEAHQRAVAEYHRSHGFGACIRLAEDDYTESTRTIQGSLEGLLVQLEMDPSSVDLLFDLGELTQGMVGSSVMAMTALINGLPDIAAWRSVTISASGFPETLSAIPANTVAPLSRTEWTLWNALLRRSDDLARVPDFGDYGIAHPAVVDIDFRVMRMSANLRYATATDWLILRGRNVRDHGYEQFTALCQTMVSRPEFSGAAYSWGDSAIADCATGETGPGNATTWRALGTNHHLVLVGDQVASSVVS